MENIEKRMAVLYEYERMTDVIMTFASNVTLKLIVDFGVKDHNGSKKRSLEEYRYTSNRYTNMDHLITANLKYDTSLMIEYQVPGQDRYKNCIFISDYAIDGLVNKMKEFDSVLLNPFVNKDGELKLITSKIVNIESNPNKVSSIEFSQDIYEGKNGEKDVGVRIGLNKEFYFTVNAFTTWKRFMYHMTRCDLYAWGQGLASIYYSQIAGRAVSEIGSSDFSSTKYTTYLGPDPEDAAIVANDRRVPNRSHPVTNEDRKKNFFNNL